jgi:DNA polymerase-3 subunit beta
MKFILSSLKLLKAIQALSGVINSSNTLPILDDFLFDINDDELKITASDLETTMTVSIKPDMVEGKGQVTIPARLLIDVMKNFPDIPVSFNIDEATLAIEITTGEGRYKMVGHKSDEFPQVPVITEPSVWEIPADVLACGFEKTIFATGNDEIRPIMTGVYMAMSDTCLTFVATDAHKLVRYRRMDVKSDAAASFIVPKKPINQLKNILAGRADEPVHVEFNNTNASFTFGEYKLICRLIEGRYPNYNAVIPENNPFSARVDRQALISALKRVSVFCNQSSGLVKLELGNNNIKLTGQDNEYATRAEEFILCEYTSNPISIGFSCTFLLEIAGILDSEMLKIEVADPSRPGVIRPADENPEDEVLMLLMPMRVED